MKHGISHKIKLFKEEQEIICSEKSTILKATLAAQLNIAHACGGRAKCSTCRVVVIEGLEHCSEKNKKEKYITDRLNFPEGIRLACQTKINGDISIRRMISDQLDIDIISDKSEIALGSQKKLTIVFTDIVNYTSFAEKFPPYDIVHVLNRYFRIMNTIIQENNGFISDIAGDGILAVFGTEQEGQNSVLDAINAIQKMNDRLDLFNKYLEDNFNVQFGIRAGVHYGNVIIGPFDTGAMKKLAVMGDNVNYASRIEFANKEFNTKLLLSETAYHKVKNEYPRHNRFETTLKGKTGKYNLYEIIETSIEDLK